MLSRPQATPAALAQMVLLIKTYKLCVQNRKQIKILSINSHSFDQPILTVYCVASTTIDTILEKGFHLVAHITQSYTLLEKLYFITHF